MFCLASLASSQYDYAPTINYDNTLEVSNVDNSQEPIQPAAEEYDKVFYSYSAPEQEFEEQNAEEQINKTVKKHIRVIFIKGPENTALENAALQLAKGAADQHTAIYVLSKQSDIGSLAAQLQEIKSKNTARPEVHFVKYRTQADAETAQRAIQAQYDNIPGTTSNSADNTASVLNFASKSVPQVNLNNANTKPPATARTRTTIPTRSFTRNSYLPPSRKY